MKNESVTFINRAIAEMLGYNEYELIGVNLQKFIDDEDYKKIRKQTEIRKQGKTEDMKSPYIIRMANHEFYRFQHHNFGIRKANKKALLAL